MNTFSKIVATILVLGISIIGLLMVAAIPPDWDFKGTSKLTEEEYINLINEEDLGSDLNIIEITEDRIYKIEYDFSQDGKIEVLEHKTSKTTLVTVITVLVLGITLIPIFIYLGIWKEVNFISKER